MASTRTGSSSVHSKQSGEEEDETIAQLLSVESPENRTEIVVHVNKLKEGWDVTNLYTIVPLRAASSKNLVEQSIGRGLRLPYGERTGVTAVDRLTIVAHDKFQAIIDEANNPNSIIRASVVIGRDIGFERKQAKVVKSRVEEEIAGTAPTSPGWKGRASLPCSPSTNEGERKIAQAALQAAPRVGEGRQEGSPFCRPANPGDPRRDRGEGRHHHCTRSSRNSPGIAEQPDIAAITNQVIDQIGNRDHRPGLGSSSCPRAR